MTNSIIPSVNFHLWEPCNMRCKFCFAGFKDVRKSILPKGHLQREQAIEVVRQLAAIGFEKITFAGGEATLCPWLPTLIKTAKQEGLTTMIVSNGSRINDQFLFENSQYLDWIAISIDSLTPETNISMGRAISGNKPLDSEYYFSLVGKIKEYEYGFKINTVVNRLNYKENLSKFIQYSEPQRWKVLQVLPIRGQNDKHIDSFKISEEEFDLFISNHIHLEESTNLISERNNQMKGSYVMVDPAGRFFDNMFGTHNYGNSILKIGSKEAIKSMNYELSKFLLRGGLYNWKIE